MPARASASCRARRPTARRSSSRRKSLHRPRPGPREAPGARKARRRQGHEEVQRPRPHSSALCSRRSRRIRRPACRSAGAPGTRRRRVLRLASPPSPATGTTAGTSGSAARDGATARPVQDPTAMRARTRGSPSRPPVARASRGPGPVPRTGGCAHRGSPARRFRWQLQEMDSAAVGGRPRGPRLRRKRRCTPALPRRPVVPRARAPRRVQSHETPARARAQAWPRERGRARRTSSPRPGERQDPARRLRFAPVDRDASRAAAQREAASSSPSRSGHSTQRTDPRRSSGGRCVTSQPDCLRRSSSERCAGVSSSKPASSKRIGWAIAPRLAVASDSSTHSFSRSQSVNSRAQRANAIDSGRSSVPSALCGISQACMRRQDWWATQPSRPGETRVEVAGSRSTARSQTRRAAPSGSHRPDILPARRSSSNIRWTRSDHATTSGVRQTSRPRRWQASSKRSRTQWARRRVGVTVVTPGRGLSVSTIIYITMTY